MINKNAKDKIDDSDNEDYGFVFQYDTKLEISKKGIPVIVDYLDKKEIKSEELSASRADAIFSLGNIMKNDAIIFEEAFFIFFCLSDEYSLISDRLKNFPDYTLNGRINSEDYWDSGSVDYDVAIFFFLTFLMELHKVALTEAISEIDVLKFKNSILINRKVLYNIEEQSTNEEKMNGN
jgi:hypothetical protein